MSVLRNLMQPQVRGRAVPLRLGFALVFILSPALFAQSAQNPVVTAARNVLNRQARNLVGAAQEMPPEKYSFRPTPQQMAFGALMAHVAQSNTTLCNVLAGGEGASPAINQNDGKERIVAAVKQSFDVCSKALASISDSQLGQKTTLWAGHKATKAQALLILTNDWADHYSAAATYLRLNGLLPPSARR